MCHRTRRAPNLQAHSLTHSLFGCQCSIRTLTRLTNKWRPSAEAPQRRPFERRHQSWQARGELGRRAFGSRQKDVNSIAIFPPPLRQTDRRTDGHAIGGPPSECGEPSATVGAGRLASLPVVAHRAWRAAIDLHAYRCKRLPSRPKLRGRIDGRGATGSSRRCWLTKEVRAALACRRACQKRATLGGGAQSGVKGALGWPKCAGGGHSIERSIDRIPATADMQSEPPKQACQRRRRRRRRCLRKKSSPAAVAPLGEPRAYCSHSLACRTEHESPYLPLCTSCSAAEGSRRSGADSKACCREDSKPGRPETPYRWNR